MNNLIIRTTQGWEYEFRKLTNKPVEFRTYHTDLGELRSWVAARNYNLKAVVSLPKLAEHFGLSVWQYQYAVD